MVVVGDSDFASNRFLVWGNNRDLFLNAVAWLVDEEDQIGERPSGGGDARDEPRRPGAVVPGQRVPRAVDRGGGAGASTLIRRRYL